MNSKADLKDLNNVLQSLEMKADQNKLEMISRAIENKADKYELQTVQKKSSTFETDNRAQQWQQEKFEYDKKMQEIEKTILRISKDQDTELENLRKQLMSTI